MESTEIIEEVFNYSDQLDTLIMYQESINGYLFRLTQSFEFLLALVITTVICVVYYIFLKYFTRF